MPLPELPGDFDYQTNPRDWPDWKIDELYADYLAFNQNQMFAAQKRSPDNEFVAPSYEPIPKERFVDMLVKFGEDRTRYIQSWLRGYEAHLKYLEENGPKMMAEMVGGNIRGIVELDEEEN